MRRLRKDSDDKQPCGSSKPREFAIAQKVQREKNTVSMNLQEKLAQRGLYALSGKIHTAKLTAWHLLFFIQYSIQVR